MNIEQLLQRAQNMLEQLDKQLEEREADMLGYPNMQNICQLMQTIAQLRQAQLLNQQMEYMQNMHDDLHLIEQDFQYIMRQFDGFSVNGFPVVKVY